MNAIRTLPLLACAAVGAVVAPLVYAQQVAEPAGSSTSPIAIVPVDASNSVTGALKVAEGKALIANNGSITSTDKTTEVILPHRGTLRVCAATTLKLTADSSVPAGETPGLMMALDHGAIETSFATGRNSDILLTPDFRILLGGPAATEVKIRLGAHGDTCVDNPGPNAPYVLVTSVFDGSVYRVQPGQRVMFQHGSIQEVVDQEKEPCGCPAPHKPGSNDFPLAQSAGLAPLEAPTTPLVKAPQTKEPPSEPLVYQAAPAPSVAQASPTAQPSPTEQPTVKAIEQPSPVPAPQHEKKKRNLFKTIGRFFRRVFGAD